MGEYFATFQFHGLAMSVEADTASSALAVELEKFWCAFQSGPSNRRDLAISLRQAPDWRPLAELQKTPPQAYFDETKIALSPERYLIWSENTVVTGDRDRIDVFCRPGRPQDAKHVSRFLVNLAFTEALRRRGIYYVHAACVVRPDGKSFLISGDSGHGKTTLTLALLRQGYRYLSDDAVFLDTRGGGFRVLGYPKAFHVADAGPAISGADAPSLKKSDFNAERAYPGRRLRSTPRIDAIVLPELSGLPETNVAPVSQTELLTSFFKTSTSVFFEPSLAGAHLAALRELVSQAKGYRLSAGLDVYDDPQRYGELFEELPCAA